MSFSYHEPDTVAEASRLLAEHEDAAALAGGVSLMLLWRLGLARPTVVVGLRQLDELRDIRTDDDGLWIGALATHRQIEQSAAVRDVHPVFAETCATVGTVRIRNQGTLGGNLTHADPAQDPPPTLIALGAHVVVAGPDGGRREVPTEELFTGLFETALGPGELIVGVRIPPADGTRSTYKKFLPRTADDYCTVSVAASVRVADDRVAAARIGLAGVGPTPRRAHQTEAALIGQPVSPALLREAADAVDGDVDPIDDHRGGADYKRRMAAVWVRRALEDVTVHHDH